MQIAIDTTTEYASVALVNEGRIIAEMNWFCGLNHTVELLPRLTFLLRQAQLEMKSATAIIAALGPGSFNGLRVGVTTAKGLALSLDVPIVGVSSLAVEAYQHAATGLPVCATHNAGREEIATATYRLMRGKWQRLAEERITTVDALCAEIKAKTIFCGEFVAAGGAVLKEKLGSKAVLPSNAANMRRAGFLAELGLMRLDVKDYDDLATLQPLYLRRPPITERVKH